MRRMFADTQLFMQKLIVVPGWQRVSRFGDTRHVQTTSI